jgi:hypothetical protein
MSNLFEEMEADQAKASSIDTVDGEGLKSLAEVAREVTNTEAKLAHLEEELKETKKKLLKLTDEDLPALLQEIGVSEFKLDDGSEVKVRPTYGAHIKADNKVQAFDWLREHGYDDIIKNVVSFQFGRGEDADAARLIEISGTQGFHSEQKQDVHPGTLKAFVKERIETGDELPMELFGAYVGQRAVVRRAK